MRILIVTFITCLTFFLTCFPVFATGGTGEESFSSDASSSSSVPKRARSSSLPSRSSAAALPGLQPPSLGAAVFGGVGSSSAVPVLPPLSVGSPFSIESLGALLNQALSPVAAALTTLTKQVSVLGERLEKMEGNVDVLFSAHQESLKKAESRGLETKALALPPELVAKVAAAVENRKLTETDGESELFTSDELKKLRNEFYHKYNLEHPDIYNICLLFLSLNIRIMSLDLQDKNAFTYRLLFCLLENILSKYAGATDFQREKGKILHYALVIFNRRIYERLDELKWFFRGHLDIDPQGGPLIQNEYLLSEKYREFYFRELVAQALQESEDLLALEACFYVAMDIHQHGASIILDDKFIARALQKEFGTYNATIDSRERIFELLSAKIVRFFHSTQPPNPSSKLHSKSFSLSIHNPSFASINPFLQGRLILTHALLYGAWFYTNPEDNDSSVYGNRIYDLENPDATMRLARMSEHARNNFTDLPRLFEILFKTNLMDLSNLPKIDEMILRYLIIRNTFVAQGYYLRYFSLEEYIDRCPDSPWLKETPLLFLSSLFYYFSASMSKETEEEKRYFVEKMKLFQKIFEERLKEFDFREWRGERNYDSSSHIGILVSYRVLSQIPFYKGQYDSFEISAREYHENKHQNIKNLWESTFYRIYEDQQKSCAIHYYKDKMLEMYTKVLIEALVTTALLSHKEKGGFPSIDSLTPMSHRTFCHLFRGYFVLFNSDNNKFLSSLLYLLYPDDISLEDAGFQDKSLDDIRSYLRELLQKPQALEMHSYQQQLVREFLDSTEQK